MKLTWDKIGERFYENGVDRGVLFVQGTGGTYGNGVAWSGLTGVSEKPSGAEATAQYADNMKYLTLVSVEEMKLGIEAFTYPPEFAQCDGSASVTEGVTLGQQPRKGFGFVYRTKIKENDNEDFGYKLHFVYGCKASPSEKGYKTDSGSPEAMTMSWDVSTTPVSVEGYKPTATVEIDSSKVPSDKLKALEEMIYGTESKESKLPMPDEIIAMMKQSS